MALALSLEAERAQLTSLMVWTEERSQAEKGDQITDHTPAAVWPTSDLPGLRSLLYPSRDHTITAENGSKIDGSFLEGNYTYSINFRESLFKELGF